MAAVAIATIQCKPKSALEPLEQFNRGFGGGFGAVEEIRERDVILQRPGLFGLGGGFEEIRETDIIIRQPNGGFEEIRQVDIIERPGLLGGLGELLDVNRNRYSLFCSCFIFDSLCAFVFQIKTGFATTFLKLSILKQTGLLNGLYKFHASAA